MAEFNNLIEALEAGPADRPFVTFWVNEDEQEAVTFGGFRSRVRTQAAWLRQNGTGPGDCVVVIMQQGIAAMTAFVGAMMLGAVPAFLAYPNDWVEPAKYRSGLAGVTANLRAKIVVVDQQFPGELLEHVSLSDETKLICSCGAETSMGGTFRAPPKSRILADDIAFIQHSAGTTGLQKGVALTHAAVLRQLGHLGAALRIRRAEDRIYSWLPLYHDMGLIACFMLPMVCHIPVVMQSPIDWVMSPETMLEVITEHKCTLAWLPNFAFQFVARRTRPERRACYDLSSMRAFINCSEPVRAGSMDEFEKAFAPIGLYATALHTSYAMAENVFAVSQSAIPGLPANHHEMSTSPARIWADARAFRNLHEIVSVPAETPGAICFVSSGRLLPNQSVRIISESGAELPPGDVGEIVVNGDCLFDGYYNRPDLTAGAISKSRYHTGDLGFLLHGELYVVGRKKDLIIIGGENLYPQDIEELVASHPAIHDGRVVAMGVYNPDLGTEEIVLIAEVQSSADLADTLSIERELRNLVMAGMAVSVGTIFLKPPKWIVKSTAGKSARGATLEKLVSEHPELRAE